MVIYEVNIQVNREIYIEFAPWLKSHIQDILKIPGFLQATLLQSVEETSRQYLFLSVHYQLENQAYLDTYLTQFAPKLRQDALQRFPNQFSITRRILQINEVLRADRV